MTPLPPDPDAVLGYRVMHARTRALVGVVESVLPPPARGAPASLRVVNSSVDARFGAAVESHTLPYVADVLSGCDVTARVVVATPPPGLLRLGRQRLLVDHLRPTLLALARASASARSGGVMPSRADLVAAGRADLADDIEAAGGFAAVAAAVGLRARRRPVGYWDNTDALDAELSLFVAAHWVELAAPGRAIAARRGGRYFYNVATRRVRWDAPFAPSELALDDSGAALRLEDEADRLMPGRAAVLAAGRYDLHHAIVYHGGYRAVGDALDRPPAWPPSRAHRAPRALASELRAFAAAGRRARKVMPTVDELADAGRGDLLQAVVWAGGTRRAAEVAGLTTRRRAAGEMADLGAAAAALRAFAVSAGLGGTAPTQAALAKAGRWDLRYAASVHGAATLARAAGLTPPSRGRPRKE